MPNTTPPEINLLVVIDRHEAVIYRAEVSESFPTKLIPYDPLDHGRHFHSAHEWTDGVRQPERRSFYEAVAKTLGSASKIVVFGSGTGHCDAMEQLLGDLTAGHPGIMAKVIVTKVLDTSNMTETQLLIEARALFSQNEIAHTIQETI